MNTHASPPMVKSGTERAALVPTVVSDDLGFGFVSIYNSSRSIDETMMMMRLLEKQKQIFFCKIKITLKCLIKLLFKKLLLFN